jgi:Beta-lactamase.
MGTSLFDAFLNPWMKSALCGVPEKGGLPGYYRASQVPWWTTCLPGAGGIGGSIRDLASYAAAHLSPPSGLRAPIELATRMHAMGQSVTGLGWVHERGVCWHNGATAGFRAFVAFHAPTACAVALLANSNGAEELDPVGFRVLDNLVRERL